MEVRTNGTILKTVLMEGIFKQVSRVFAGNLLSSIFNMLLVAVLIKGYSIEAYGVYAYILFLLSLSSLLDIGFGQSITGEFTSRERWPSDLYYLLNSIYRILAFIIALLLISVFYFSSPDSFIGRVEESNLVASETYLLLVIGVVVSRVYVGYLNSVLSGSGRIVVANTIRAIVQFSIFASASLLIFGNFPFQVFLIFYSIANIVWSLVLYNEVNKLTAIGRNKYPWFELSLSIAAPLFKRGLTYSLLATLSLIILLVLNYVSSEQLSIGDYGVLSFGLVVIQLVTQLVYPISNVVYANYFSRKDKKPSSLIRDVYYFFTLVFIFAVSLALLFPYEASDLVLGKVGRVILDSKMLLLILVYLNGLFVLSNTMIYTFSDAKKLVPARVVVLAISLLMFAGLDFSQWYSFLYPVFAYYFLLSVNGVRLILRHVLSPDEYLAIFKPLILSAAFFLFMYLEFGIQTPFFDSHLYVYPQYFLSAIWSGMSIYQISNKWLKV